MTVSSTAFTARGMTRPAWLKQGLMATLAVALMGASLSAEARSVETAYGELDIEGTPQRVVTLYEGALDVAVASQVTPLGTVTTRGGDGVASYIQPQVPDIKIIGVQAAMYPSMFAAIHHQELKTGGASIAEGISVKQPGHLTQQVV